MRYGFDHEGLDVYQLAREVALWVHGARFGRYSADLRDQALQVSRSVVLNIAEGCSRGGKPGKNHFRMALGSTAETCAALDLARIPGKEEQQDKLRRIGAMLGRMVR